MAVFPLLMKQASLFFLLVVVTPLFSGGGGGGFVTAQPFIPDVIIDQIPPSCKLRLDVAESCVLRQGNPCFTRIRRILRGNFLLPNPTDQSLVGLNNYNTNRPCRDMVNLNCRFINACDGKCTDSFSRFMDCLRVEYTDVLAGNSIGGGCDGNSTTVDVGGNNSTDVIGNNSTDVIGNNSTDTGNSTSIGDDFSNSTSSGGCGGVISTPLPGYEDLVTCTIGPQVCSF